jgi:hypothetical protein
VNEPSPGGRLPIPRLVMSAAMALAAAIIAVGASRPLDQPIWRQGDLVAMTRAFAREDANIAHPRIAWRGTSSGLAESELPIVPWTAAMMWRAIGERDLVLRLLPAVAGLAAIVVFWRLSRRVLPPIGAAGAVAAFSLNPLVVFTSTSVQSDAVMLLGSVSAVLCALRWTDRAGGRSRMTRRWAFGTAAGLALAGCTKVTALHVGLVVAFIVIARCGWRALVRVETLTVAAGALALPLLWAAHARSLYRETGLSLGVSNEHHVAGSELFTNPALIRGIVLNELRYVWVWGGVVAAAIAVLVAIAQWRGSNVRSGSTTTATRALASPSGLGLGLCWLAAAALMLVAAGRTTGDGWAFYYHIAAVPGAALVIGAGVETASRWFPERSRIGALSAVAVALLALAPAVRASVLEARPIPESALRRCAREFLPRVAPTDLILASGGTRLDDDGNAVAFDASYFFQWLDRFGWTIALEDQNRATVADFGQRGAAWFIAERSALSVAPGFENELRSTYGVADSCDAAVLFDLRANT